MEETFLPLIEAAYGLDLSDAAAAEAELTRRLPPDGEKAREINAGLAALLEQGVIAGEGELPVRYSRIAKAGPETSGFSVDVVVMNGPGPLHRHPLGEVDWCVPLEGSPTFDGRPPGWVVCPTDSVHVPTVADGTMLVVFLLPEGSIEFME